MARLVPSLSRTGGSDSRRIRLSKIINPENGRARSESSN